MNIDIPEHAKVSDILKTVQGLEEGGHIYCSSERHFSLLKICLIKLQKTDLNIYLLDDHGFTVKQVSARKKAPSAPFVPENVESETEPVAEVATSTESEPEPAVADSCDEPTVAAPVEPQVAVVNPVETVRPVELGMSNQQISAVRDLEQALRRCKELGLLLVGFSDGLVAVPEPLGWGVDAISSADALEVESFEAYKGYEADDGADS
ncbi:MAG: hypothetical protein V7752_21910 [Halopseudomonas sp.]